MQTVTESPQNHQEMVDWLTENRDKALYIVLRRGVAVFALVVASLVLTGALSKVAVCLAVAVAMFWLVSLFDYMACHWLGTIAQRHEMFRPRDPDVALIGDALVTLIDRTVGIS